MHHFNAYRHNFKFNVLYQTLVKIVKRRKKGEASRPSKATRGRIIGATSLPQCVFSMAPIKASQIPQLRNSQLCGVVLYFFESISFTTPKFFKAHIARHRVLNYLPSTDKS
jgi:hypothetical protein